MPLFKKTPIALLEPPKDLEPHEHVYQIRYTKEIFRDYKAYLNRINLYRQRLWTCKTSGKTYLTYEEALVSEKQAIDKVQQIPKELVAPALQIIQFSMLSLKDLADTIADKLQGQLFVGAELQGRKNDILCPCKILKVIEKDTEKVQYVVAWFDKNKKVKETTIVNGDDLIRKKFPFSRSILKSFIRESTYRSFPWVLHYKLAIKYGITNDPPEELKDKVFIQDGVICNKKRKNHGEGEEKSGKHKKKKVLDGKVEAMDMEKKSSIEDDMGEPIKYPIDDLLVQPDANDPIFTERPSPSRDFNVPMDCVGDLLMVWDFCTSFSRFLNLWPFSLEDFENAICHKDGNLTLIFETHAALLRLLIKDNNEYLLAVQKRNRKLKVTLVNWTEYLCDFLDMINIADLSTSTTPVKRGHYGLLDAQAKLGILRELVYQVIESGVFREKLDENVEQRQVLGATRRGEALEEARRKREEKQQLKGASIANGVINGHSEKSIGNNLQASANENHSCQNGEIKMQEKGESNHTDTASNKMVKNQNMEEVLGDIVKYSSRKEAAKQLKVEKKDTKQRRNKDQRREYFEREMEKQIVRTNSLGKDRNYNRYWWFRRDGRIFVESSDSKLWGYYSTKEELNALMGSLNLKGERERALHKQLEKFHARMCSELEKRSKDLAQQIALEEAVLRRSTRIRAVPREDTANAFLKYVNKWKED